jgi:hypothetical protein
MLRPQGKRVADLDDMPQRDDGRRLALLSASGQSATIERFRADWPGTMKRIGISQGE